MKIPLTSIFIKNFRILIAVSVLVLSWNQLFSLQLNISWKNLGPGGGGTMYAPAISPHDPNLMFISCDMSGVYRSTDGGTSWTMINFHQLNGSISDAPVFHPTDPNIIWDEMGSKLMRSTDAGITWNKVWDMPSTPTSMICSRSEPLALYVAFSSDSLYFSSDGINFKKRGNIKPLYLAENVNIIIAADKNNVWYSIDKGLKFNNFYMFSEPIQDVAVSDSGVFVLTNKTCVRFRNNLTDIKPVLTSDSIAGGDYKYVKAEGNYVWITPGTDAKVFISTDGGNSFKSHYYCNSWSSGLQNAQPDWIAVDIGCGWGGSAQGLCISRQNPGLGIWTDMGSSYIISDTGRSWFPCFTEYADAMPVAKARHWKTRGLDVTTNWDIFINPNDKNYVQAAYTDILGSISEDGGNSWRTTHNTGIPDEWTNTTYNYAYDKDTKILWGSFAAKHDISSWNGANWNPGGYNKGGICHSTNNGKTWIPDTTTGLPNLPVTRLAIDYNSPASSRRIYAAIFTSGIWKTEDGGKSWKICSNGLDIGDGTSTIDGLNNHITEVDVYPNGDVFALKSMYYRSPTAKNDAGLWKSTNHGDSWQFISSNVNVPECAPQTGIDTKLEHSWAFSNTFLVDEKDENHIYVGAQMCNHGKAQGGLYETTDGGKNWSRTFQIYGVARLTKSKYYPDRYYMATIGNGLWYSIDNMKTWQEDSLLPFSYLTRVTEDIFDTTAIWVNTFGGGVWNGKINTGNIQKTTAPSYNAIILTLRQQDGIKLDYEMASRMDSMLNVIVLPDTAIKYYAMPEYDWSKIMLQPCGNAAWTDSLINGILVTGDKYIDSLSNVFHLKKSSNLYGIILLEFDDTLQTRNLCDIYMKHGGLCYAQPDYYYYSDDYTDITYLPFCGENKFVFFTTKNQKYTYVSVIDSIFTYSPTIHKIDTMNYTSKFYLWNIPKTDMYIFHSVKEIEDSITKSQNWWIREAAIDAAKSLFIYNEPFVGSYIDTMKAVIESRWMEFLNLFQQYSASDSCIYTRDYARSALDTIKHPDMVSCDSVAIIDNTGNINVRFFWNKQFKGVNKYWLKIYGNGINFSDSTLTDTTYEFKNLSNGYFYGTVQSRNFYYWSDISDHNNSCNFNITTSDVSDNENNARDYLEIYPNPSTGIIYINSNYAIIEIYNQLGELVKTLSIDEKQWTPENNSSGLYEVVAKKGSIIQVRKVIIIK